MHLFLVANLVTTSKALVTTSDAPVPSSLLLLLHQAADLHQGHVK